METTPPGGGSSGAGDGSQRDPSFPPFLAANHPNQEHDEAEHQREADRRTERRLHVENPAHFISETDEGPDDIAGRHPRIFPLTGKVYLAVSRKWAEDPLRDPEARIGVCDRHPLPTTVPAEENPCPYQSSCYMVATSPGELRQALFEEALIGSPDLPKRKLWKSIDKNWRIVELDVDAVRCVWLFDDPALSGGEPQLRHDGQLLPSKDSSAWNHVREALDEDAAMVVLSGDPEGTDLAQRIVIFTLPGLALTKVKAFRWGRPMKFSDLEGWRGMGRGTVPRTSALPNRQPLIRRVRSELKFRYRMWRASRTAAKAERKQRRDQRRRESAERWELRAALFGGIREILAIIREGAETVVAVAKAIAIIAVVVGGPSVAIVITVKLI